LDLHLAQQNIVTPGEESGVWSGRPKRAEVTKALVALPCFVRHEQRPVSNPAFILRRADVSRKSSSWQHEDYDVFDGERELGRIYLVDGCGGKETWFWGVSFQVIKRKSYGYALSLDEAKAAFRAEYEASKNR
jgi:hypothetical protein